MEGLRVISAEEVRDMEPQVSCVRALHSASTGIVDSHSLMAALQVRVVPLAFPSLPLGQSLFVLSSLLNG